MEITKTLETGGRSDGGSRLTDRRCSRMANMRYSRYADSGYSRLADNEYSLLEPDKQLRLEDECIETCTSGQYF